MDVIFEPQRGRPFSIEVGFFDTVLEIKEKIQKYQGIPVPKQTLVFNGQILQDERDVDYCVILHNSHIHLLISPDQDKPSVKTEQPSPPPPSPPPPPPPDKIQLLIKMHTSNLHTPIEMDVNDSIQRLKEKIHEMEGGNMSINRLVLQLNGTELLQDHRLLRECEISDRSEIEVTFRPSPTSSATGSGASPGSKKLKVMVLPKCGTKKIAVEMNASDNVGELRKELQKSYQRLHFPLPQEGYFFIYKQNVMDDDRSFRWHQVGQGDTIEIFNGSVTGGS